MYTIHQSHALPLLRGPLAAASFSAVVSASSGLAWWAVWKGKFSARGWAIAASLTNVLLFFWQFISPSRPVWDHHVSVLLIGIVGLVAFLWPDDQQKGQPPRRKSFFEWLYERDAPQDLINRH